MAEDEKPGDVEAPKFATVSTEKVSESPKHSGKAPAQLYRPYVPTIKDQVFAFILSPQFQCGCQLMVGHVLVTLFIFIRSWTFPNACLAATLYLVCSLLVSADNHIGTKMMGCAMMCGSAIWGIVLGCCVGSLARVASGDRYTAFLCVLSVLVLGVLTLNRMGANPPFLWVLGMVSCLTFGLAIMQGQFLEGRQHMWHNVAGYLLADVAIGVSVTMTCAALVLPSLASDEMRKCVVAAIQGIGQSTSRSASRCFVPELQSIRSRPTSSQDSANLPALTGKSPAAAPAVLPPSDSTDTEDGDVGALPGSTVLGNDPPLAPTPSTMSRVELDDDELDDDAFLEMLKQATMPPGPRPGSSKMASGRHGPPPPPPHPPVAALRPVLARARTCIGGASLEPPWFMVAPVNPLLWGQVIARAEFLLTRVSGLEMVLEESSQMAGDSTLECLFTVDIIPQFRRAYAQVATTCATLGQALQAQGSPRPVVLRGCSAAFGLSWQQTKDELRGAMAQAFRGYWRRVRGAQDARVHMINSGQMRSLMFLYTLTTGIIDAMEDLEKAVGAVLGRKPKALPPVEGGKAGDQEAAAGGAGAAAPAAAVSGPPPLTWLQRNFRWAKMLALVCLGLPIWGNLIHTVLHDVPMFFTPAGFKASVKSRVFQAGIKYWLCTCTVLLLIIGLSANPSTPEAKQYKPIFAYIATCLAMSERVEATVSKVWLWLVGTVVGGTLGYVAMIDADLSTNPYGLAVIIGAFTLLVGFWSTHQFRVAIVLSLMTFNSIILCQYKGCCGVTGTKETYAARVLAIIFGGAAPVLISNLILPWHTSDWALEVMAQVFNEATKINREFYTRYFEDGKKALEAARAGLAPAASSDGPITSDTTAAVLGVPVAVATPTTQAAGVPVPKAPALPPVQARMANPLVAVQISLIKDAVVWQRGILATPQIVPKLLQAHFLLVDRLAAMSLVVMTPPSIQGRFTGWAFETITMQLHEEVIAICDLQMRMAAAVGKILRGDDGEAAARLEVHQVLDEIEQRRVAIRQHTLEVRRNFHHAMRDIPVEQLPHITNPDDAVRVYSFLFTIIKYTDKAVAVARMVADSELVHRQGLLPCCR